MNKNSKLIALLSFIVLFSYACGSDKKPQEDNSSEDVTTEEHVQNENDAPGDASTEVGAMVDIAGGKAIFEEKACVACHQEGTKVIGPALKVIAIAYEGERDGLRSFLKGEAKPKIDPEQEAVMKPQIEITKNMPEADLEKVMDYILSIK